MGLHGRNRIAIVTEANRGLGLEICRQLSKLGFNVILSAPKISEGQRVVKQLKNEGLDVTFFHLDVANQRDLDLAKNEIVHAHGHLDVLINNAAILYDYYQTTVGTDLEIVYQAFATNLFGPWKRELRELCGLQHCRMMAQQEDFSLIPNQNHGDTFG